MEVKGTALNTTNEFVKNKFGNRYNEWFNSLPPDSKKIFGRTILSCEWYSMNYALVVPTQKICDIFYNGSNRGAWEASRFNAECSLRGVYKMFIRFGSVEFLLKQASRIFSTYFRPSELKLTEIHNNTAIVRILDFPEPNNIIEMCIGGWIERALEISGCTEVKVKITNSLTKGDPFTEYLMEWQLT